jgi:hypothetical protein
MNGEVESWKKNLKNPKNPKKIKKIFTIIRTYTGEIVTTSDIVSLNKQVHGTVLPTLEVPSIHCNPLITFYVWAILSSIVNKNLKKK